MIDRNKKVLNNKDIKRKIDKWKREREGERDRGGLRERYMGEGEKDRD